ncbi:unnamed protein product [Ascophyllum nodosum]
MMSCWTRNSRETWSCGVASRESSRKKGNNKVREFVRGEVSRASNRARRAAERKRMKARFSLRTTNVCSERVIQKAVTTFGHTDYAARSPRKMDSTTTGTTLLAGG